MATAPRADLQASRSRRERSRTGPLSCPLALRPARHWGPQGDPRCGRGGAQGKVPPEQNNLMSFMLEVRGAVKAAMTQIERLAAPAPHCPPFAAEVTRLREQVSRVGKAVSPAMKWLDSVWKAELPTGVQKCEEVKAALEQLQQQGGRQRSDQECQGQGEPLETEGRLCLGVRMHHGVSLAPARRSPGSGGALARVPTSVPRDAQLLLPGDVSGSNTTSKGPQLRESQPPQHLEEGSPHQQALAISAPPLFPPTEGLLLHLQRKQGTRLRVHTAQGSWAKPLCHRRTGLGRTPCGAIQGSPLPPSRERLA
ncbi:hypothetical protein ACSSS7_004503 [Eimeria intestinalis]